MGSRSLGVIVLEVEVDFTFIELGSYRREGTVGAYVRGGGF